MGATLDVPQADPGKIEATQLYSQAHQVPVGGNLLNVSRTPGWAREGLCARVQGGSHSTVPEAENEVRLESVLRNRGLLQALYPRLLDSRVSAHGSHQKCIAQCCCMEYPYV